MSRDRCGPLTPTWITDLLAVGQAPLSYEALDQLRALGVRAILNLCAEFTDLHQIEAAQGFEVYHLPIPDEQAPDLDELEKALAWLDESLYLGKKTYIHCRHGIGRTGTVLNAYLLRRGLGHGRAWLKLRKLSSQPANYCQWRAVRRYGGIAPRLKVRAPSVEYRSLVDLSPFFEDYRALVRQAEAAMPEGHDAKARCGRDHTRCCRTPPSLSLVEAAHLNATVNTALDREQRQRVVEAGAARSRGQTPDQDPGQGQGQDCPLLRDGACLVYAHRPLRCRTSDLPPDQAGPLWTDLLDPALQDLSRAIHVTLAGCFLPEAFPPIDLAEAVCGRYVQMFFDCWRKENSSATP